MRQPASLAAGDRDAALAGDQGAVAKMKISHQQMNLILMAVEHGFREGERGKNLQGALASVFELYEVAELT
jgi:hypothetical protein